MTRERPADPRPPRPPRPARRLPPRGDTNRRLGITLLAIIFVLSLFAGRLVQLQGMESGNYRKLASQERDWTIVLPAHARQHHRRQRAGAGDDRDHLPR